MSISKSEATRIDSLQYTAYQGIDKVFMTLFLDNNHVKFLCDMLFGKFQTNRRCKYVIGIEGILSKFESKQKKKGHVNGYDVNPLSCIDFVLALENLG